LIDDLLTLLVDDRIPQLLVDQLQMLDLLTGRTQFIARFGKLQALRGDPGFERGQFFLPGRALALPGLNIQR